MRDPVRPRVERGVGDRGTGGVSDETDCGTGRIDGVDRRDDRFDMVA